VSIDSFNKGLDDAYLGRFNEKMMNNRDYVEGLEYGEDIERDYCDKEKTEKLQQEEYELYMERKYKEDNE
jgi:hypothetical protein